MQGGTGLGEYGPAEAVPGTSFADGVVKIALAIKNRLAIGWESAIGASHERIEHDLIPGAKCCRTGP